MNILSLFDGISCARVALERAGFQVEKYFSSEVDKYAIQVSLKNYPDNIQLGDVKEVTGLTDIDLLIGGSPCQDLSIAKANRKGLDGDRSGLFWEYVRILKEVKPKYFILENVNSMPKEAKAIITEALGVEPIMINAALVSAQNRKRLFWTNIPGVNLPEDKGIFLKDILEDGEVDRLKSYCIDANYYKGGNLKSYLEKGRRQLVYLGQIGSKDWAKDGKKLSRNAPQGNRVYCTSGKSSCLSAKGGGLGATTGLYAVGAASRTYPRIKKDNEPRSKQIELRKDGKSNSLTSVQGDSMVATDYIIRKLTPIECERLQGLNDDYTSGISNTQRYKCLGNAFNVDVVAHILSFIKK